MQTGQRMLPCIQVQRDQLMCTNVFVPESFLISFLLSLYYFLNVPGMLLTKGLCTAGFLCLEHNSSRYPCSWLPQFLPCHCSKDLSQTDLKPFKPILSPSWCGSVDWVPACEPKGCLFNSQSGHMPGLQPRSPVGGAQEAITYWCVSLSASPSLPLCLKINK